MFSFLNTAFLFAAAAALIPLIIHLFSKRKVKIVEFSSLRHLKVMQRRQVRRLKIRQLLLLIIRMLILLGVVLAFARPTTRDGAVGSHAAVSAVILIDNSASMNRSVSDGNLFDVAVKRTADILATFGQSDEICLLPIGLTANERTGIYFGSASVAQERLTKLKVSDGLADLEAGIEAARDLLDEAVNLNREIYIVTDRQRRNLPETPPLENENEKLSLYFVDIPAEETDNLGILSLDFGGQLLRAGHDFTVAATIKNYGDNQVSDILVSLFLDDNRVAQSDFALSPSGETVVKFTRAVASTGFHSGYVELSDDRFEVDNRYYFSFYIPDQFSLLIIDGDAAASFISLALEPSPETGRYWSVKTARPDQLIGVRFSEYDVVMLIGAPTLSDSYVARLKSFVRRGKSLFISYGGDTDIREFNRNWSGMSSINFLSAIDKQFSRSGYYTFGTIEINHPIFSVFHNAADNLPEAKFYTLPEPRVSGASRTLMTFSGDRPALVESIYGSGRVLTFCGPIAPPYTDLVSHSFFVPFVSRIAEYLASDMSSLDLKLYAGENVTRSLASTISISAPVELKTPGGEFYRLAPEEEEGNLVYKISPVLQAGIYSVRYNNREIDRFAVNVNTEESNLDAVDNNQLAASLGAADFNTIEQGEDAGKVIASMRVGRELWQIFLWIVVLLLVAESLLSRSTAEQE